MKNILLLLLILPLIGFSQPKTYQIRLKDGRELHPNNIILNDSNRYVIEIDKKYYSLPKQAISFTSPSVQSFAVSNINPGSLISSSANNQTNAVWVALAGAALSGIGAIAMPNNTKVLKALPYIAGASCVIGISLHLNGLYKLKQAGHILSAQPY
jgi:hypothetical protein